MLGVQKHDHQSQNGNPNLKLQTTDSVNPDYSIKIRFKTKGTTVHFFMGRGWVWVRNRED